MTSVLKVNEAYSSRSSIVIISLLKGFCDAHVTFMDPLGELRWCCFLNNYSSVKTQR